MKTKITLITLSVILILAAISYGLVSIPYSKGIRSGRLVKISKKGLIYSTYEGTLDLGSGDQLTWDFSVHDKQVGKQLLALSGRKVKLDYDELFFRLFYDTKYNVKKFSSLSPEGQGPYFCQLVNIIRSYPEVSKIIKSELMETKNSLIEQIRKCQ